MIKINLLGPKWSGTVSALKYWELLAKWHNIGRTLPTNLQFVYGGRVIELRSSTRVPNDEIWFVTKDACKQTPGV